jgi:hypothetical protein
LSLKFFKIATGRFATSVKLKNEMSKKDSIISHLTSQTINQLKGTLWEILIDENVVTIERTRVAQCISVFGNYVLNKNKNLWPDIINMILQLTKSPSMNGRKLALFILTDVVQDNATFFSPHLEFLRQIIDSALDDPESKEVFTSIVLIHFFNRYELMQLMHLLHSYLLQRKKKRKREI